jgi:hypothetical protein
VDLAQVRRDLGAIALMSREALAIRLRGRRSPEEPHEVIRKIRPSEEGEQENPADNPGHLKAGPGQQCRTEPRKNDRPANQLSGSVERKIDLVLPPNRPKKEPNAHGPAANRDRYANLSFNIFDPIARTPTVLTSNGTNKSGEGRRGDVDGVFELTYGFERGVE